MTSIYIHIPFCDRKCEYCNFFVIARDNPQRQESLIEEYLQALHREIDQRTQYLWTQEISTIYFGGGTPGILSLKQITWIVDHIHRVRNCENIGELSIELNPDPFEHTLQLVTWLTSYYQNMPRVRCSFGIQTFDDAILQQSWRWYIFNNVRHFLRQLREIKQATNVFNLDFISFGTRNTQTQVRKDFFETMVNSLTFDSYSLYLLELFPWSKWHSLLHHSNLSPLLQSLVYPNEDAVMEEYDAISLILQQAWYHQYETSNRSLSGKDSIHNHTYRNMQPYLWLGASASWLIHRSTTTHPLLGYQDATMIRYTNTTSIQRYISWDTIDQHSIHPLMERDYMIEHMMLGLRTAHWIIIDQQKVKYLSPHRKDLIAEREQQWRALYYNDHLILTHNGMKLSNHLITDLIEFTNHQQ